MLLVSEYAIIVPLRMCLCVLEIAVYSMINVVTLKAALSKNTQQSKSPCMRTSVFVCACLHASMKTL